MGRALRPVGRTARWCSGGYRVESPLLACQVQVSGCRPSCVARGLARVRDGRVGHRGPAQRRAGGVAVTVTELHSPSRAAYRRLVFTETPPSPHPVLSGAAPPRPIRITRVRCGNAVTACGLGSQGMRPGWASAPDEGHRRGVARHGRQARPAGGPTCLPPRPPTSPARGAGLGPRLLGPAAAGTRPMIAEMAAARAARPAAPSRPGDSAPYLPVGPASAERPGPGVGDRRLRGPPNVTVDVRLPLRSRARRGGCARGSGTGRSAEALFETTSSAGGGVRRELDPGGLQLVPLRRPPVRHRSFRRPGLIPLGDPAGSV